MKTTALKRLAFGGFASLLLAACNTTLSLNTENLQRLIQTGIQEQNPGITVSSVTCPERPIQQGDKFECTATTSAGNYRVSVEQTDAAGNVHWVIAGQI